MPITLRSIVVIAPEQFSCGLAGEAAILSLSSSSYYGLNSVGARIWELIREPHTVQAVLDRLLADYDVAPDRCEADLLGLLQELATEGLVEVRNE